MTTKCPRCQSDNPDGSRFCSECGVSLGGGSSSRAETETVALPQEDLLSGALFADRYQVIEELGRGGMGRVYKVLDTKVREKVALKLIKPEIAADALNLRRFSRELRLARSISHRSICRMYDLGEAQGTYYITMEYVAGEDLKSLIRKIGLPPLKKVLSLAKQICNGLSEAEGTAGSNLVLGTPAYMSPEQVDSKNIDRQTDLYSLGVILFELVTGTIPFHGDTSISIAVKHKKEIPPEPKRLNPLLPDELNRIILKCLEKDKRRRYRSADELYDDLDRLGKKVETTGLKPAEETRDAVSTKIFRSLQGHKILASLAVLASLAAVFFIWRFFTAKGQVVYAAAKPSLVVMYFENNTGDDSLDHWRKALAELLIADISQSQHIRVISSARLYNILEQIDQLDARAYSSDVLSQVVSRTGVEHVLVGDFAKAGDVFRVNIMLQNAENGETIASEMAEAKGEENLFTMVDELTMKIKDHFNLSSTAIADDIDLEIADIATDSPEAMKYFTLGRRHHRDAEYPQAIGMYQKALDIDPNFAVCFYWMSQSYGNMGHTAEEKESLLKALGMKDRLSERDYYLIRAQYFRSVESTYGEALEAFQKLLSLYPDDQEGNNLIGMLLKSLEDWDKAVEHFNVCIQSRYDNSFYYVNMAETLAAKGDYLRAMRLLESYLNNFRDVAWVHGCLAINYFCQKRYDLALMETDDAQRLDDSHYHVYWMRGDIYHAGGDFIRAELEYSHLLALDDPVARMYGRSGLASLYFAQGQLSRALEQLDLGLHEAVELDLEDWILWLHNRKAYMQLRAGNPEDAVRICEEAARFEVKGQRGDLQRRCFFLKGLAYLKMGERSKAEECALEFKAALKNRLNIREQRYHLYLLGMIQMDMENLSRASDYFSKAMTLVPHQFTRHPYITANDQALFLEAAASAAFLEGKTNEAKALLENILDLTAGRLHYGDIYARAHHQIGKIYEIKGWEGKAIEHYSQVVDIWREADHKVPEQEDARRRLSTFGIR